MEKDFIQIEDIVTCYQKQVETLSKQKLKIELLSEDESIINPIYSSFIELNNTIRLCEKYWRGYCFERDSIIDINNDIRIYSFPTRWLKEDIPKLVQYHSERANEFYNKYLESYKVRCEKEKETQQSLISLFNSIQDIYPNFNNNIVFTSYKGASISFEQKSKDITSSYFKINYKELICNIFKLATNQIDREMSEKKSDIVNIIAESIKDVRGKNKIAILKKE